MKWRKVAAWLGDQVGYEVVPRYMAPSRPMARRLQELFATSEIERVIDIGANRGQYHDFLRFDVEFTGPIHSVEPDPELAQAMRSRGADDSNWTVHEFALGRTPGRALFNRMQQSAYNSFRSPLSAAPEADPQNTVVAQFEVEVRRFDDLLPILGNMRRTFVKIDTQGFDLEVLAGGLEALAAVPLVQTEVSFQPIYDGIPGWADSIRAFEAQGFCFADMFIIQESRRHGIPIEGDCILARRR
jgi:FkbM family methyltransferase